jgi:hypothetical protein
MDSHGHQFSVQGFNSPRLQPSLATKWSAKAIARIRVKADVGNYCAPDFSHSLHRRGRPFGFARA